MKQDENMGLHPQARQRTAPHAGTLGEMTQAETNSRSRFIDPGCNTRKISALPRPTQSALSSNDTRSSALRDLGSALGTASRQADAIVRTHNRVSSHASSTKVGPRVANACSSSTAASVQRPATAFAMTRSHSSTIAKRQQGFAVSRPASSMDTRMEGTLRDMRRKKNGAQWDQDYREESMNQIIEMVTSRMKETGQEGHSFKEAAEFYKTKVNELERSRDDLIESSAALRSEVATMRSLLITAENTLKNIQRNQEIAIDDLKRQQCNEIENAKQKSEEAVDALTTRHKGEVLELRMRFERELEDQKSAKDREINEIVSQAALDTERAQLELSRKEGQLSALHSDLQGAQEKLNRERKSNRDLRQSLDIASNSSVTLESSIRALKLRIEFLESGREEQSRSFAQLNQQMMDAVAEANEAKDKLRREETVRRKLHNQVQELKGNIRVFCRVRPSLENEDPSDAALIQYPDETEESKEINLVGPEEKSSLGTASRKSSSFSFDRVFGPSSQNSDVFEEISQLVQSALDGYNVCIFCYGQTGSGKTFTMSSRDGMIPRAVHQIYDTAKELEEKGWTYRMEGNFVEVYNENLNDLLGKAEELDKKRHEIRHDVQRCKTMITDITTVNLDSPETVESILNRAAANRSVAATKSNERSSRSHSVFILKLQGENNITGERCEGTLNLVDLAGSERLSQSGATGDRLKETQSINRSLSCLGDVISALGQGKEGGHIPFRNSKLTYLLQFSLGGNSKTLMFVMISPLQAHLPETFTSLKFAKKVHNTHIGTAKRQARVRD